MTWQSWLVPALAALVALAALAAAMLVRRRAVAGARRAEAAARDAQAARARSLGLVAAELRGPGLAVLGHAGRLRTLPGAEADAAAVEGFGRHLLRLADDITDLVAAEAGPPALREEVVPLDPLLREAVAAIAAQLGPARREWRLAPDLAGLALRADRRALRGVLQHVLARAARLSRDGDWIEIRAAEQAETVSIVVEDEGSGQTADDMAAEAREAGVAAARTRGLGLGLAVARALLRAHGGELTIEAAPGVGARAWLTLPRSRVTAAATEATALASPVAGGPNPGEDAVSVPPREG